MEHAEKPSMPGQLAKLAIIGWKQSGKSVLADVLLHNKERYQPLKKKNNQGEKRSVIMVDYLEGLNPSLDLEIQDYSCEELRRDTAGDSYRALDLALFALDVSADNFEEQSAFLFEEHRKLQAASPGVVSYLVLTKNDLPRQVLDTELEALKKALDIPHHFVAAFDLKRGVFQPSPTLNEFKGFVREALKAELAKRPEYQQQEKLKTSPFHAVSVSSMPLATVAPLVSLGEYVANLKIAILEYRNLSESQQKMNFWEFQALCSRYPNFIELKKGSEEKFDALLRAIWDACDHYRIVLNSNLKKGTLPLLQLLKDGLTRTDLTLDDFRAAALKWGEHYQAADNEASAAARYLHESEDDGILKRLDNNGWAPSGVWCSDLDLREVLKGLMTDPDKVVEAGTYILPPTDIKNSDLLTSHFVSILKKKIDGPITAMIPVQTGGHWRAVEAKFEHGLIQSVTLWDSMATSKLDGHYSYNNLVNAARQAQSKLELEVKTTAKAIAAGIQKNGWSCGDFVTQKCLQAFPELQLETQKAIRDADPQKPLALREAMIARIDELHPELKAKRVSPSSNKPNKIVSWSADEEANGRRESLFGDSLSFGLFSAKGDPGPAREQLLGYAEQIEDWVSKEPDPTLKANKVAFQDAFANLREKIDSEVLSGAMSTSTSKYVAQRAVALTDKIIRGSASLNDIETFQEATQDRVNNYSWRMVVGAFVGAAIGVVLGAMLAAMAWPVAALTALYLGSKAGLLGSTIMGIMGAATGAGVGVLLTIEADPLTEMKKAAQVFVKPDILVEGGRAFLEQESQFSGLSFEF